MPWSVSSGMLAVFHWSDPSTWLSALWQAILEGGKAIYGWLRDLIWSWASAAFDAMMGLPAPF